MEPSVELSVELSHEHGRRTRFSVIDHSACSAFKSSALFQAGLTIGCLTNALHRATTSVAPLHRCARDMSGQVCMCAG